ncbi:hypothetical protein [Streptomyces sp. LX-29]|nr:hypothetical protein [Streptomyces sp. LX-29]
MTIGAVTIGAVTIGAVTMPDHVGATKMPTGFGDVRWGERRCR